MKKRKAVIATENQGKLQEYEMLLEPLGFELFTMSDFDVAPIVETGNTFRDNALIKAKALRNVVGEMIIADDSGLEVDALGKKPGIHSKRFSDDATDESNNTLLLKRMENERDRRARFVTVIVLLDKDGSTRFFEGYLDGYIHTQREGDNGFGYDPLFIPAGYTKTLAELNTSEKNRISHRANALKKVVRFLEMQD